MKIYVNREPKFGPWGGGAKTINKLVETLLSKGHDVVYQLEGGISIMFCFDPRPNTFGENIDHLYAYKRAHLNTRIIQRVGDVGTHNKPHLTELIKYCLDKSDYFIFPSEWSKKHIGFAGKNYSVIHNCPPHNFYKNRKTSGVVSSRPRIVTHHWSTNPKKGFDIYEKLDKYCCDTKEFEFCYIGRKPDQIKFENHIKPVSADVLADMLPHYDIYLTASEEEAGANHVLEGLAAGLPVVYKNTGGSIVEYCRGFGESYGDFSSMLSSLRTVVSSYRQYAAATLQYKAVNDSVVDEYVRIIESLMF